MVYWSWWPVTTLIFSLVGFFLAAGLGWTWWQLYLEPHYELGNYQIYRDVDPTFVTGERLQDAGLVDFSLGVSVDRGHGGCFVGGGHTYCIAPIVQGGLLHEGLGGSPRSGSYDYFAIGMDCCTCPNQDFRCGEWNNAYARGGIRSINKQQRPYFRLAVEDWIASHHRLSTHPLFFDWTQDAVQKWNEMLSWSIRIAFFSIFVFTVVVMTLAVTSGKILQVMISKQLATAQNTPLPPPGYEQLWAWFLPEVIHQAEYERKQIYACPVTAIPWYGDTAAAPAPDGEAYVWGIGGTNGGTFEGEDPPRPSGFIR
jgi:hypothetical protein